GALLVASRLAAALGRPVRVALTPGSVDDVRRWRAGERGEMPGTGEKDARGWLNRACRARAIDPANGSWPDWIARDPPGEGFAAAREVVEVVPAPTASPPPVPAGPAHTSEPVALVPPPAPSPSRRRANRPLARRAPSPVAFTEDPAAERCVGPRGVLLA